MFFTSDPHSYSQPTEIYSPKLYATVGQHPFQTNDRYSVSEFDRLRSVLDTNLAIRMIQQELVAPIQALHLPQEGPMTAKQSTAMKALIGRIQGFLTTPFATEEVQSSLDSQSKRIANILIGIVDFKPISITLIQYLMSTGVSTKKQRDEIILSGEHSLCKALACEGFRRVNEEFEERKARLLASPPVFSSVQLSLMQTPISHSMISSNAVSQSTTSKIFTN